MTDLTAIDLSEKTAVELREIGKAYGIKGASKGKKADLLISLADIRDGILSLSTTRTEAEWAKAHADEDHTGMLTLEEILDPAAVWTDPADRPAALRTFYEMKRCPLCRQAAKKSKACRSECGRNIGTGSGDRNDRQQAKAVELCVPCLERSEWESMHGDYGHDIDGPDTDDADGSVSGARVSGCWICRPELDRTSKAYVPRVGTSRAGMKMNVTRQTGAEKAEIVKKALAAKFNLMLHDEKSQVILAGDDGGTLTFEVHWDSRGAYLYGPSTVTINGKTRKVRNVSELLRLAG